ncbi:MAG: hypothetical protein Ct9H300mP8_08010 [Gammaproteobacteria bacterium]|nr:MAG: hypothetical protein Ct9H300mP8_08010 [Gammaproteobacteria bacterium]
MMELRCSGVAAARSLGEQRLGEKEWAFNIQIHDSIPGLFGEFVDI